MRATVVPAVGVVLALLELGRGERITPGVLARVESPYAELRVVDSHGLRYLLVDGGAHTIVNAETGSPRQPYVFAAEIAADLSRPHGRLLLLGLGGGGAAGVFAGRGWQVDAVDIDPAMPELATRFFRLQSYQAHVIVAEARQYLQRGGEAYDVVLFDVYGSAQIPFHLVTREAFAAVGWQDPLVHALVATLRAEFSDVIALPTAEPPDQLGNVIVMAANRALELNPDVLGDPVGSLGDEDEHFRVVARHHAWENRYDPGYGRVLTDDWNPVDLRAEEINHVARLKLRALLPDSLTSE